MKKPKNYQTGPAPIYLRITVNGQRAEISTGREYDPKKWNKSSGRANGTKDGIKSLNAVFDNIQSNVYEAQRHLVQNGKFITDETLKNQIIGKSEKSYMLIKIFKEHNSKVESLIGNGFASATFTRYETCLRHTANFLNFKYGLSDVNIASIDNAFISDYEYYLRSVRKCGNNAAVKYIKNFKKIVNICLSNGWISSDPFANYEGKFKPVNSVYLTADELQRIADKHFEIDRLAQIRDIFLFCCFTGLAYVDIKNLKRSQVTKGLDGNLWIFTTRQKTKTRSAIPLLPCAIQLLNKYSNHPICVNKDMSLPVPSNQKMNAYLKEISAICGIDKVFTSHTARHTFATTVTLTNGVPIESVSEMLGHSSIKQTQHYAKVINKKVSEDMITLRQKFELRIDQSMS